MAKTGLVAMLDDRKIIGNQNSCVHDHPARRHGGMAA